MKHKVLFIDDTHPVLREELEKTGFLCDHFPGYSRKDHLRILDQYQGVIIRGRLTIDKEFLDRAPNLEFIGRVGAGMENIDVLYAEKKGIRCLNAPEGNRDALGEHTLGMLLCLLNKICMADREVRNGLWKREENRGMEIRGKTIGIIGYGNMGSAFAQRLKGFEARVLAYDKYKTGFGNDFVRESDMKTLFAETDILSLHVPLTEETYDMVNSEYLNTFAKPVFVINTARGKVLNTEDLVANIEKGKVLGAALDVLEYESRSFEKLNREDLPGAFRYLVDSGKVVLTPHIAGWTHESRYKLARILADKIMAMVTQEKVSKKNRKKHGKK